MGLGGCGGIYSSNEQSDTKPKSEKMHAFTSVDRTRSYFCERYGWSEYFEPSHPREDGVLHIIRKVSVSTFSG